MQTAYLIAAHHQPNHLAKLIKTLDSPECTFFIHIDAKVDETIFKKSVGERNNIVYISLKQRCKVDWGGFSQVKATLALLSAAIGFGPSFHRFCLLSGADFPIKRKSQILADLDSSKEFMRVDRAIGPSENNSHCRNVGFYWFLDSSYPSLKRFSGRIRRRPYKHIALYQGANWWALTRDCVDYILRFLASNPRYYSFFKYTLCPDEIFFHSIVKHSPFASRITHDFETAFDRDEYFLSNEHGCHYIDWKTKKTTPKILDLQDLDRLISSKSLFARKFDEQRSGDLIAMLENRFVGRSVDTPADACPPQSP